MLTTIKSLQNISIPHYSHWNVPLETVRDEDSDGVQDVYALSQPGDKNEA